jgi:hypothetical protein
MGNKNLRVFNLLNRFINSTIVTETINMKLNEQFYVIKQIFDVYRPIALSFLFVF